MNAVANDITQASTALFFWSEAFNEIKAASSQFYELFIGQNETMRQQMLATQSSLAAVQDVYLQGIKLTNPKDAIQAFEKPIKASLESIAVASIDLVGVTSAQLTDVFQIILTNAGKITNQSKEFADPIKAAEKLTISMAGAFGAMGIPLNQASQEITSIATGMIDMNSRLAKSLNITNEQVRLWGSQGRLVDELVRKLEPFVAGNAIGARSIGGIVGNMKDLLQIVTRLSGESLTALAVDGLNSVYQYLKKIQPEIQQTLNQITNFIVGVVQGAGTILAPFVSSLESVRDSVFKLIGAIGGIIGSTVQLLIAAFSTIAPVVAPIFSVLSGLLEMVAGFLSDPLIQQMVAIATTALIVNSALTTLLGTLVALVFYGSSGTAFGAFLASLIALVPGLTAAISALGLALSGLIATTTTGAAVAGFGALTTAIGAVVVALLPLAAAIAAVAAAAALLQSATMKDTREAIESVSGRANETGDKSVKTVQSLRELKDKEFLDGGLNDENKAKKKSLITQGTIQSSELESQIADLKAIDTKGNESLENAKQASIAQNELMLKSLGKFVGGLSTSAKPILEVGGAITQLNSNVAAFDKQIKDANSDAEFQAANKGITGLIQKQVELGVITEAEGKKRLQRILDDARVVDGREAAQKAIEKIQDIEMKQQLDGVQQSQAAINLLKDQGLIGEAKAEQELTTEKIKEVDIRSAAQKIAHAERMRQIQVEMNAELGKIDKEIEAQQKVVDKLKIGNAPKVQVVAAERELTRITTSRAAKQTDFVDVQKKESGDAELEVAKSAAEKAKLEKQQRDKANQERLKDFDEQQKIVNAQRDTGVKDNQESADASLKIAQDRAEEELSQVASKIDKLSAEAKRQGKTVQQYDKEGWEALQVQQAEAQQKLANSRKDAFEKKLADKKQDLQEELALVDAAQAKGDIDNQQAAQKTAELSTKSIDNQLQLINEEIASSKGQKERLEELNAKKAGLEKELTDVQKKQLDSRLADLRQDAEERVAVVKAAAATGKKDNQEAAIDTAKIERASAGQQLDLIRQRIEQVQVADKKRGKVSVELLEDLKKQEADVQVKITEIAKKEMESRLADLQQDAEERSSVVAAANAMGNIDNQQAAVKTSQIQQASANDQLKIVQTRIKEVLEEGRKTGKLDIELLEELQKKEADIQVKITEIQKQELQKRLADLQQDSEERVAVITAANATGAIDNQKAAVESSSIQQQSLNQQLELIRERARVNSKNKELLEELLKQEADVQVKITEVQKQELQKRLSDLQQDSEERIAIVETANAKGLINNQEAAVQSLQIQETSSENQIELIQKRIQQVTSEGQKVGKANIELLEELRTQEANAQKKIIELRKQGFDKRVSDVQQDGQERLAVLEGQLAQGLLSESDFSRQRYELSAQAVDAELVLIKQRQSQLLATDVEGQEVLAAQEANLKKKRQDNLSQFLESQLGLIDRANKKATDDLQQAELNRQLIAKESLLRGSIDRDAAQSESIEATKRRIQQEIALESQKVDALKALPAFSDPVKESERQSKIRELVKKTTELRLQLLDEEKKAFDALIDRQIKGIQNQARERELASDVEVRAIEFQSKQYDLLSRSLETQNKLLQSRGTLANALNGFIQGEYKILQNTAESESEKKRLIQEAANAQLVALKQQQVVAQKNLEIEIKQAEIAQKRAEFEAQIAENKAKVGAMKAEADVLKAESTLQKVQRDPNASEADVAAAKLDVTAARAAADAAIEGIALAIANKELTKQQGDNLGEINQNKRETLGVDQATQSRSAQSQAIQAIVDPGERSLAAKELAGRLTPAETEQLARVRQTNYEAEQRRISQQNERDALAGIVRNPKGQVVAAQNRSREVAGGGESPTEIVKAVESKVPSLSGNVATMRQQQQKIATIKPDANPLLKLQSDSNGYQREMVSLLKQIQQRPNPEPGKQVSNNFNIKAEAGINEAQVLGIFGGVTQEISRMVR